MKRTNPICSCNPPRSSSSFLSLCSSFSRYEDDVWIEIAKYLDGRSLVMLATTCKWFYKTLSEEWVWKFACLRDLGVLDPGNVSLKWKKLYASAFDGSHSYLFHEQDKHIGDCSVEQDWPKHAWQFILGCSGLGCGRGHAQGRGSGGCGHAQGRGSGGRGHAQGRGSGSANPGGNSKNNEQGSGTNNWAQTQTQSQNLFYIISLTVPQCVFLEDATSKSSFEKWRDKILLHKPLIHGLWRFPPPKTPPPLLRFKKDEVDDLKDEIASCWTNLKGNNKDNPYGLLRHEYTKHGLWTRLNLRDFVEFTLNEFQHTNLEMVLYEIGNSEYEQQDYLNDELGNLWCRIPAELLWQRLASSLRYEPSLEFMRYRINGVVHHLLHEVRLVYKSTDSIVTNFRRVHYYEAPGEGVGWVTDGLIRGHTLVYVPSQPRLLNDSEEVSEQEFNVAEEIWPALSTKI